MAERIKCVIYARYSSERQKPTSIAEQVRECKIYAKKNGWEVWNIYEDQARTGRTMVGRDQLRDLLRAALEEQPPFKYVLVYDSSRLGREVAAVWGLITDLRSNEVFIRSVVGSADTEDPRWKQKLGLQLLNDDIRASEIGDATGRSLRFRAKIGLSPGGRLFGYRSVRGTVKDVQGHRRVKYEPEAKFIKDIFGHWVDDRWSLFKISETLKKAIKTADGRRIRTFKPSESTIRRILQNEAYTGAYWWNTKHTERDGKTGRRLTRPNERSEWIRVKQPSIISKVLFEKAQKRLRYLDESREARRRPVVPVHEESLEEKCLKAYEKAFFSENLLTIVNDLN